MADIPPCPCDPAPGQIREPHHIPGYMGHMPTLRQRNGGTFGAISRQIIEDPCAVQSPCPILTPGICNSGPKCEKAKCSEPPNLPPYICGDCCEDLNRGPYLCNPGGAGRPDMQIYRCCEPMSLSYAGYVPGKRAHGTGKRLGVTTFGVKTYMQNCFYIPK